MHFEGTADIGAPRERVWEFVTDAQRVSRCGPDVQRVDVIDATHFKVVARAGVGAIRTTFALDVVFTELRAPEHAAVRARGQAPGSALEMTNTLDLADAAPGRTTLRWASEVTVFLSLRLGKPVFLEGEAGVGKTEVAKVLASGLGRRLIRLQCYEGLDLASAVYEWDHARQILEIRLAEAEGRAAAARTRIYS